MSLWLKFKMDARGMSPIDQFLKKLSFKEHIEPTGIENKNYELWNKEIFEELGGELLIKDSNGERIIEVVQETINPEPLIHKTNGIIIDAKGQKISLSITLYNNLKYRKIYGDVQIDTANYSFENLFKKNLNFRKNILTKIKQKVPRFEVTTCVVGESPDSVHDMRERIFSYHSKPRFFIEDFFTTFKIWSDQVKKKELITDRQKIDYRYYFTQFDTEYLARKIERDTAFKAYCGRITQKIGVQLSDGSLLLESENKEAFDELFHNIKDDFNKIKYNWFSERKLRQALRNWFSGQQELW